MAYLTHGAGHRQNTRSFLIPFIRSWGGTMITIIGCGNLNRSDDAVGAIVAQRLEAVLMHDPIPGVQVVDAGTAGMEVMFRARGSTSLIVVDACTSGTEAGAVFHVPGEELEAVPVNSLNLHDFRWQHALYVGRILFRDSFPSSVEAYLIEAKSLALGIGISQEAELAVDTVVDLIHGRLLSAHPDGDAQSA
jgi:hydrogenase maturation protease